MKYSVVAVSVALSLAILPCQSALAGPYSDDLAKCLVRSTTDADKTYLVKWMFAAVALHPQVRSIASISDTQRDDLNKNVAQLFVRLLTESCRSETQEAGKYEGAAALQGSFQLLGQVAAARLFSDPAVARGLAELENHVDKQELENLLGPTR